MATSSSSPSLDRRTRITVSIALTVLFVYTASKFVEMWPAQPFWAILLAVPPFAVMIGSQFVFRLHASAFETRWFQWVAWLGSFTMGVWSCFIFLSLPVDLFRLLSDLAIRSAIAGPEAFDFQVLSSADLHRGIFATSAVISFIGFLQVLKGPRVREVPVSFSNLPPELGGFRIVQISDLHIGPTIRRRYVESIVDQVNTLNADMIFVTGDIADAKAQSIEAHIEPLGSMKSRYGVYYVTGNHEYYWDAEELVKLAAKNHLTPLLNENKILQIGRSRVMVAGVTDPQGPAFVPSHRPDLRKAREGEADFKILLAHRPGVCMEAEPLGFDLQFSGHTHAGQYFPFTLVIPFAHKYYRGLNRHGRMQVYVNPGTGYWGPANRFGVQAEITLLTLKKLS